jgi:hypothetical protein
VDGRLSRRRLLTLSATLPFGVLVAACSSAPGAGAPPSASSDESQPGVEVARVAEPPPPPFIVAQGEQEIRLMAGTPHESPLYVFGSGRPGNVLMVLGGVHGNEPGGWMAAERLVKEARPTNGALLVLPRANQLAIPAFLRTTDALGDLNRLYPGDPNGLPMERMAAEIVETLRAFHVGVVIDMHESWAFYKDRPLNGTAFLGQTVATNPTEPGISLAQAVVESVNTRIRSPQEELFFREFTRGRLPEPQSAAPFDTSGNPAAAVSGGSRSSLGLPRYVDGLVSILVEMGQQQPLERRVALHVEVYKEIASRSNIA